MEYEKNLGNNYNYIDKYSHNEYSRETQEVTEEEYQSILQNNISESKKEILFKRLISNILLEDKQSEEYASSVYRYLLNREGEYSSSEIDFITRYTIYLNYHRIKYDEDGKVKPGYEKLSMPKINVEDRISETEDILAGYALSTVLISRDLIITPWKNGNKEKLFQFIQALSHEMVHYKQDYEAREGMLTLSSFKEILSAAARGQQYDDEERNYYFRDIEVEAQVESMTYAVEIGQEYLPDIISAQRIMLQKKEDYLIEEALSFQYDDESTLALRDFYDIGMLSVAVANGVEILGNKIDLLERYPQLNAFFNENRQMRSEEELLTAYQYLLKDNNELASIYEQFLVYIYHREDVMKNQNLPIELIEIKRMFILRQVRKELKTLNIIHQLEKDGKRIERLEKWGLNIEKIVRLRKQRLELYYQFLKSLQTNEKETCEIIKSTIDEYEIVLKDLGSKKNLEEIMKNTIEKKLDDNNNNNKKGY